jgi:hypothetical protein
MSGIRNQKGKRPSGEEKAGSVAKFMGVSLFPAA